MPIDTMTCTSKSFWSVAPSTSEAETTAADLSYARAHLASLHVGALIRQCLPLTSVLHALCECFEGAFGDHTCLVLLLDRRGLRVETAVGASMDVESRNRFVGRSASELEGVHLPGLRVLQTYSVQALTGEVTAFFVVHRKDGHEPLSRGVPQAIERFGQVAGAVIERIRQDDALRQSAALLEKVQSLSSSYSFSWCSKADKVVCSTELRQLYGFDREESFVTLDQLHTRICAEDLPSFRDLIVQARRGLVGFEHEHRLRMPDDSFRYLHLIAHQTRVHDNCHEYIGVVQDVTQQRRTQETLAALRVELAAAERLAGLAVMSAAIAHEVNQPLSGIVTNAHTCRHMLSAENPNVEGALETVRRTIRDAERACGVIKRVRTLFGGSAATREPMNLNDAVNEVVSLVREDLQRNQVILHMELNSELPELHGDRVQLQQVVLNLISNASEAMREIHGRPRVLVIRTSCREDHSVCLSVQDTGHGIEPEKANRLFDAFFTTKSEGMGMGLCISRSIIELHGGKLSVESNAGPGATFSFAIPAIRESGNAGASNHSGCA